jgi:hypothetical protein
MSGHRSVQLRPSVCVDIDEQSLNYARKTLELNPDLKSRIDLWKANPNDNILQTGRCSNDIEYVLAGRQIQTWLIQSADALRSAIVAKAASPSRCAIRPFTPPKKRWRQRLGSKPR